SSTYTNSSAVAGTYTLKVEAENTNGTADPQSWTWTVGSTGIPVDIDPSEGTVEISQGGSRTFNVTSTNQNVTVEWFIGDETKGSQTGASPSYEFKGDAPGEYTLKAVIT